MPYTIAIRRLDGSYQTDDRVFEGAAPDSGRIIEHETGGESIKVKVIRIRTVPGRGIGGRPLDHIDAAEIT